MLLFQPKGLWCRLGNDKGRSVSAWGFWGDILNSPYHSFGTSCSEPSFLKISNKQFVHTAVSVAEYNVTVRCMYLCYCFCRASRDSLR